MAAPDAGPGEAEAAGGRRRRRPPLSALSAFSSVPAGRAAPPELRYFQREAEAWQKILKRSSLTSQAGYLSQSSRKNELSALTQTGDVSTYDAIFKRPEGYNKNLHRCDREHAKSRGLNVNEEERARPVAVLSSSEYGRRINKPIEEPIRDHARINHVQAEFYRKNGITCLLEKPSPSLDPC